MINKPQTRLCENVKQEEKYVLLKLPEIATTTLLSRNDGIRAFSLMELAMVVLVLGLLAAAGLRYSAARLDSNNLATTNNNLDVVEQALLNYRIAYGRLPCPALIADGENSPTFGKEYDNSTLDNTNTIGSGNCSGASFADITSVASYRYTVYGAIPTKTLQLPDKYAYDAWGKKILYVLDKRITAYNAFLTYPISNSAVGTTPASTSIGSIIIKNTTSTSSGYIITHSANAIYALVSFGKDGHGGYVRNPSSTSVIYNAGANNADEQQNCHCTAAAVLETPAYDNIFIQNSKNYTSGNSGNPAYVFDDIVRFKTRQLMALPSELQ